MRLEYGFTDLFLTSHAGLPAFTYLLKAARLPALFGPSLKTIPDTAIYTPRIALPALGKSDFEAVSAYRNDVAFGRMLRLNRLPSTEIMRQRIDAAPALLEQKLHEACPRILETHGEPLANQQGFVPLDFDTSPMDNSGTQREGVSCTS